MSAARDSAEPQLAPALLTERALDATPSAAQLTKGERTRQRLLSLAVERFGERGHRATSVSEIARAAGVTQAAAYAYFPSKGALFDAAVDADVRALVGQAEASTHDAPAAELVPRLITALLAGLEQHHLTRRVLGGLEPHALTRLADLPALARLADLLEGAVRDAQGRGEVRDDLDPALFAAGAEAIIVSLVMTVTQAGPATAARRQRGVLSIFDAVLRAPGAHE